MKQNGIDFDVKAWWMKSHNKSNGFRSGSCSSFAWDEFRFGLVHAYVEGANIEIEKVRDYEVWGKTS